MGDNFDETWDPYHTCYGHDPSNFQPFKNIFDSLDRYYTNEELYENLRPEKATIPYMYDGFSWPHCELQGYDMSNEWCAPRATSSSEQFLGPVFKDQMELRTKYLTWQPSPSFFSLCLAFCLPFAPWWRIVPLP